MLKLLIFIAIVAMIVWLIRAIRDSLRQLRPADVDIRDLRPQPVGRHAWRIDEIAGVDAVTIEVAHPTKGTRRSWTIERALPDFDELLRTARREAEALHAELAGSQ